MVELIFYELFDLSNTIEKILFENKDKKARKQSWKWTLHEKKTSR